MVEGALVCPVHACSGCGLAVADPSKRASMVRCFRCPKSFHLRCRPRDLHNLGSGLFLCISHVNEQGELPPMPPDLLGAPSGSKRPRELDPSPGGRGEDPSFTPGLILRLDGLRPGTHVFSITDTLKAVADVRYIEFDEGGATTAYAR